MADQQTPSLQDDYSVTRIRETLGGTLRGYIESQYHIRDVGLILERSRLLAERGSVAQAPYVEATPVYELGEPYSKLNIPAPARDLLTYAATLRPRVGIFPRPYVHQAQALEAFLTRNEDLVVATGTGSGKTETFLMPILGQLALEGHRSKESAKRRGVRALLLYPMNALVSDQMARVRKLLGREEMAAYLEKIRGRRVQFGMYTSRSPYPGPRDRNKDVLHIQSMFEEFYLERDGNLWRENQRAKGLLAPNGKWPCKNLVGFYGADKITSITFKGTGPKGGKTEPRYNWDKRLFTQPGDTELFTRHEMQLTCPDLLITNYSMLEYMLLRPIERSIFDSTREWLAKDKEAQFILVLDEAHTYRGAAGAEVALLIRRLRARLGISRDRFRCILTSASLDRTHVIQFASDLTGDPTESGRSFFPPEKIEEKRTGRRPGTVEEAIALSQTDLAAFQRHALGDTGMAEAAAAVAALAANLLWPPKTEQESLEEYIYARMNGWGPLEEAIASVSGKGTEFTSLSVLLFPGVEIAVAERATDALLALGTYARHGRAHGEDGRVLLPARLHLFYRGLPAQYACVNPRCGHRRDTTLASVLGRFHTHPTPQCLCGGRAYELLTHRNCGTAFLRAFTEGRTGAFAWHEPSGLIGADDPSRQLCEVPLLIETPHPDAVRANEVIPAWLEVFTGRLRSADPGKDPGFIAVWLPNLSLSPTETRARPFVTCPVCRKRLRKGSGIMDLVTKGEAPFSNLIKAQVLSQPAKSAETRLTPNGGRKSLLFSDGRQKAARLARDIPREVEQDSFRQALVLAVQNLEAINKEPRPDGMLYLAFCSVVARYHLAFFEEESQRFLLEHSREMMADPFNGDLSAAIDYGLQFPAPPRYQEALLRQLCNRFYSLSGTTLGFVAPNKLAIARISKTLATVLANVPTQHRDSFTSELATAWTAEMLEDDLAFDASIAADSIRVRAAGYERPEFGSKGKLSKELIRILAEAGKFSRAQIEEAENAIRGELCTLSKNVHWVNPMKVKLVVDLANAWWQCQECTGLSPVRLLDRCVHCCSPNGRWLKPSESDYLKSRKGFWREVMAEISAGRQRPAHICAEEHTAQLSHRDEGEVHATTERHELRFQDIVLSPEHDEGPIDVLSCTTTMEVGIDIGSLVAVGLRNVPPQRENYQQRAGRAGRRGSAISTVITFAQGGAHDNYYFQNPAQIISGAPRRPLVHTDNARIATRHVQAYLIQTYFHNELDSGMLPPGGDSAALDSTLGPTKDFFSGTGGFSLAGFKGWLAARVTNALPRAVTREFDWLPKEVLCGTPLVEWVRSAATGFEERLEQLAVEVAAVPVLPPEAAKLLEFLFGRGMLPTYAFPTDLSSFMIEGWGSRQGEVIDREVPQQATNQALSEYAPGRLVVVNKQTYRSGGVTANVPKTTLDRAAPLFDRRVDYVYCRNCTFVGPPTPRGGPVVSSCPACKAPDGLVRIPMLTPEVFVPEGAGPIPPTDREQDISYASAAQFPVPVDGHDLGGWQPVGDHAQVAPGHNQLLVVVNRGGTGHPVAGAVAQDDGFWVCSLCGSARIADGDAPNGPHQRPYLFQRMPKQPSPGSCRGQFERVYLGNCFTTDLMVLRVTLDPPFHWNVTGDKVFAVALEDALQSFAEGLALAASRRLDIDAAEFGSGHRLWHPADDGRVRFDVYLFDILSGGGGYAEQAGMELEGVFAEMESRLGGCKCRSSCQDCLRHYGNRMHHERLDRFLALDLLRYVRTGYLPVTTDLDRQVDVLGSLRQMLELDGQTATLNAKVDGQLVPLLVEGNGRSVAVGCYPGLLNDSAESFSHPLDVLGNPDLSVRLFSEFQVTRNLPAVYIAVREALNKP